MDTLEINRILRDIAECSLESIPESVKIALGKTEPKPMIDFVELQREKNVSIASNPKCRFVYRENAAFKAMVLGGCVDRLHRVVGYSEEE